MSNDLALVCAFMGPIEHLLLDDSVSEIMGNPDGSWWYEQAGILHRASFVYFDAKALTTALEVIANKLGKRLDASTPLLSVQLPDGSRLAAVLPPVVRPFPSITVRKFSKVRFSIADLIAFGMLSESVAGLLREGIQAGSTILISGGTSGGKTTLLNALTDYVPDHERLVVIEDTRELRIEKPNVLAAECQVDVTGGEVTFNQLLKASLRWRPDRIILGEVRGDEARTLLDSFNTGHGGSMATIHASSCVQALHRFSELAMRSHQQSTRDDIAAEIASCVSLVVQVQRKADGRRVTEVVQVKGYQRSLKAFSLQPLFTLNPSLPVTRGDFHETHA